LAKACIRGGNPPPVMNTMRLAIAGARSAIAS
jgi:hypothetical protein